MPSFDDVAAAAADWPDTLEHERRGTRTWTVRGRTFAWERPFSKADIRRYGDAQAPQGPVLAIRVADLGEKEAVLGAGRVGFFTIPHFEGFAAILLELDEVTPDALREALEDGWLACAPPKLAATVRPPRFPLL